MEKVSRWHCRNYPKRGKTVSIPVRDLGFDPDTITYLGEFNGSSYRWIGRYKDMPEKYLDKVVVEMYQRTIGYQGEIILIDVGRKKKPGGGNGQFWNWNECDKSVEPYQTNRDISTDGAELLLMAIAKDAAQAYRNNIRRALKMRNWKTEKGMRNIIRQVRQLDENTIQILTGSSRGEYILQRIEDEEIIKARHPDWNNVPYDDRKDHLEKELKKMNAERVKNSADEKYAHIKGRSVKH